MKSILELFAQDEIKVDTRDFNYTTDYLDKFKKRQILEEKIIDKLGEDGKELFDEYDDMIAQLQSDIRVEEFVYGYQIGALMMIDTYSFLDSFETEKNGMTEKRSNIIAKRDIMQAVKKEVQKLMKEYTAKVE
ncbi:MAG: hypothetical protein HFE57_01320 [Firmicutes bacterium]|jgi:hypothetical protein|nr:hypothetical protein [Bacillota bacterium]